MLGKRTHECPGGCGEENVPNSIFACKPCWYRLPVELRRRITHGYRHSASEHLDATAEAVSFYASEEKT